MKIRPLHDRVVVEPIEEVKQSKGGIIIPDTAKEKPMEGKIVAVGPGKPQDNGGIRKPAVKEGDKVLFGKYSGTEIKIDGKDLLVIREEDIMAIV